LNHSYLQACGHFSPWTERRASEIKRFLPLRRAGEVIFTLAKAFPKGKYVGYDISRKALDMANARCVLCISADDARYTRCRQRVCRRLHCLRVVRKAVVVTNAVRSTLVRLLCIFQPQRDMHVSMHVHC